MRNFRIPPSELVELDGARIPAAKN